MELAPCEVAISLPPIPEGGTAEARDPRGAAAVTPARPGLAVCKESGWKRRHLGVREGSRETRGHLLSRGTLSEAGGTFLDGEPRAMNAGARGCRKAGVRPLRR